jgi:hypothetical protein
MNETERWPDFGNASLAAFTPAVLLILVVILLMNTSRYGIFGLYAIFSAFVGGVILTATSVILLFLSKRFAGASFLLGLSLSVSAVLLYLVYGCVFGCAA